MAKRKTQSVSKRQTDMMNKKVYGDEPIINGPIDQTALIQQINWYNTMMELSDSRNFLLEYYQTKDKKIFNKLKGVSNTYDVKSYGWIARMIMNGTTFSDDIITRMNDAVLKMIKKCVVIKEEAKSNKTVVNIQDKIKERADDLIGEIEAMIDNNDVEGVYDFLKNSNVPALYGTKIVEYYTPVLEEIKSVQTTKDSQLKEAYSIYKPKQLKELVVQYKSVIDQVNKFADNTKREKVRKPRKKKVIPTTKKISSLQYLKEYSELKIVSVDPASIVGAQEVWLFNTTNSTLTKLVASGGSGFDVKGTSILNVDIDNSVSKRVGRKAQEVVDTVLKGGKIKLRKVFDMVSAKATVPTNRTNSATVILKVTK